MAYQGSLLLYFSSTIQLMGMSCLTLCSLSYFKDILCILHGISKSLIISLGAR